MESVNTKQVDKNLEVADQSNKKDTTPTIIRPAITKWKAPKVKEVAEIIKSKKTIAVVDLMNLPSRQLQDIRAKIKDKINIQVTKKRLLKRALEMSKVPGKDKLIENFGGMSALVCTDLDSFELFRLLKINMSNSVAKAGQISPFDIKIDAGPTPFSPGPILSELGEIGLKAAIEGGKVVIKIGAVVAKEGEEISETAASILSRLDIKPIKVGLNLIASLEDGKIMKRDVLDINEEEYLDNIKLAHSEAFKLAMSQSIVIAETAKVLIQNAERDALALARAQDILTDKTKNDTLAKADKQALALKKIIG